ncbi:MAG: trypsin-like peptidase domain-containing protein [Acidobacteria bacterium]|nr:trypsin-like peptidase domain-containing protein [Acidobacteriota bacterium]
MHLISEVKKNGPSSSTDLRSLKFILFLIAMSLCSGSAFAQLPDTFQKTKIAKSSPEQLSASFAEVAKHVEAAVVNIDTKGKMPEVNLKGKESPGDNDDILDYFRRSLPRRPSSAVGSGFIVDPRGYILTNYHVVEDSARITVRLQSGEEFNAKIVGGDDQTDLAILKIESEKDLPYLEFGDSDSINIGDWVLAVGSPFGLEQTVTAGIISQTKREIPSATAFQKFIQTDAAINRGNSGGPLVNMKGEVIGVNSQIATSTGDYNGIGFALPSNEANYVYEQVLLNGKVRRGFLGIFLDSVKKEFADVYKLPEAKGAIITQIRDKNGAAAKAGLRKDDIVLAIDGVGVEDHQDLITRISSMQPGSSVKVSILREAGNALERKIIDVKLDERPVDEIIPSDDTKRKLPVGNGDQVETPFDGLTLQNIDAQFVRKYRLKGQDGIVVSKIAPDSYLADIKNSAGGDALSENDVIQRFNRSSVKDLDEFRALTKGVKAGSSIVLHVLRYDPRGRQFIPVVVQFTAK